MDNKRNGSPADTGTEAQWAPIPDERWAMQEGSYLENDYGEDEGAACRSAVNKTQVVYNAEGTPDNYGGFGTGATQQGAYGQPGPSGARPVDATVVRRPAKQFHRQQPASAHTRAIRGAILSRPRRSEGSPSTNESPNGPNRRTCRHRHAKHGCLSLVLWLALLVVIAFMATRCVPASMANGKAIPELCSFVPLMFVPLVPIIVLALLWRRRVLAVFAGAALTVMMLWHHGYFIPTASVSESAKATVAVSSSTEDSAARIMTLNTCNGQASAEEIVRICREQNVEILCLQEIGGTMLDDLAEAGIYEILPYRVVSDAASQVDNGGKNGIWCAAEVSNVTTNLVDIATSAMPAVDITMGSTEIRVVSVHPNSPVRGAQDLWSKGLESIQSLGGYAHNYLLMGDFNSTWDHARFRELLGTSFVDAGEQAGEGFHMTYPSNSKIPSLIEIDHIVYSRDSGIAVSDLQAIEVPGTDHKALLATLEAQ